MAKPDSSIVIRNIYYMLAYAFDELRSGAFDNVGEEDFEHCDDLLAALLARGTALQIKRGLFREYRSVSDNIPTIRGRIDINETIRNRTARKHLMACSYDELTVDNLLNRIIRAAMLYLLRNEKVSHRRKSDIRSLLPFFSDIGECDPLSVRWDSLTFGRNNRMYRLLINICYLIFSRLLPSENNEGHYFQSLSESNLNRLYEKFVLNYYLAHHPRLHPASERIRWNLDESYPNSIEFLPAMKTDISLKGRNSVLIIDTKFYSRSTQRNFDRVTIHSSNMYQIFAYVKNRDTASDGHVSGLLLYARTDEKITPDLDAKFGMNRISVRTLDLNCEFSEIRKQLDDIAAGLYD